MRGKQPVPVTPAAVASTHRLSVVLLNAPAPTRRQVEVPSDLTLAGLHEVVQVLFGWSGDHLYEFVIGRHRYGDPYLYDCRDDDIALVEVAGRAGKVIAYTYDLGAPWQHRIVVDAVDTAVAGVEYPRCFAAVGPYPAEYEGQRQRPQAVNLAVLNKRLAALRLPRKPPGVHQTPGARPGRATVGPEVVALAASARESALLQDLVHLARWTATPRAVTATGTLRKPEVLGALNALGLPAPKAGFHSARNLLMLDATWRLAEDLGLVDISGTDAVAGPALAALEDDRLTLDLWTAMWEYAAVDARVLHYDGRLVNRPWVTPPLLQTLYHAEGPVTVADLDRDSRGHERTMFLASLLEQLVPIGGVQRLPDGGYQLTPLGRHGYRAVLLDEGPDEPI